MYICFLERKYNHTNTRVKRQRTSVSCVQIGKTMIDSMLLGAILTNIEVAYNLSKGEIDQLQKCHESALRKLLSLPSKTPKVML